jgi:hypothetical protein
MTPVLSKSHQFLPSNLIELPYITLSFPALGLSRESGKRARLFNIYLILYFIIISLLNVSVLFLFILIFNYRL